MVKLFNDFYFKIKQTNKKKIEKLKKKNSRLFYYTFNIIINFKNDNWEIKMIFNLIKF